MWDKNMVDIEETSKFPFARESTQPKATIDEHPETVFMVTLIPARSVHESFENDFVPRSLVDAPR